MEARKSERVAHAEGKVVALEKQLADLTAVLKLRAGGRQ